LDPETGLIPVEAQLDPAPPIPPRVHETVFSDIVAQTAAKGFLVPASALTIEDDKASIFLVDEKQIAHAFPVTVTARSSEEAVIEGESLKEGASLIVDGNYNLPDGAHVIEEKAE